MTLSYFNSEDGNNDRMEIALSKLRCSMTSMHEQEKLGGKYCKKSLCILYKYIYIYMSSLMPQLISAVLLINEYRSDLFMNRLFLKAD